MKQEKRKCRRTDVEVMISLQEISDKFPRGYSNQRIKVCLVNISKTGIAFKCRQSLSINSFYDTLVRLPNEEKFGSVIEILRKENHGEAGFTYGCRFVGISTEDQFKIDVFQIVNDAE